MQPWYIATERFGPWSEGWAGYVAWSELGQLQELVSLDPMLCPSVFEPFEDRYWPHVATEGFLLRYFVDLPFLLDELRRHGPPRGERNLLGVYRDPPFEPPEPDATLRWERLGHDLCEPESGVSALTNCGGFPSVFDSRQLSEHGLFRSYERAREVQMRLKATHPEEPHADCQLWAVFRAVEQDG